MEIKQLETIHTVLEQGSFLKAAEALGYVQSTITLHIQQLEKEVGFKLFEKQGRRMILTSEGRAFWEHARHLIDQMNALKETAAEISGGQIGHVRLGTIETVGKNILPPVLIDFFKKHPKLKLSLEFGGMKSISYRVMNGELDFGICPPPKQLHQIEFHPLFIERMTLLLSQSNPLAKKKFITTSDLTNANLLLSDPACSYRSEIETRLSQAGIKLEPIMEIGDLDTIISFVKAGIGVALLPATVIKKVPSGTIVREIDDTSFALTIGILRPEKKLGKVAEELYQVLLNSIKVKYSVLHPYQAK